MSHSDRAGYLPSWICFQPFLTVGSTGISLQKSSLKPTSWCTVPKQLDTDGCRLAGWCMVGLLGIKYNHTDYDSLYLGSSLVFFIFSFIFCLIGQRKDKLLREKGG